MNWLLARSLTTLVLFVGGTLVTPSNLLAQPNSWTGAFTQWNNPASAAIDKILQYQMMQQNAAQNSINSKNKIAHHRIPLIGWGPILFDKNRQQLVNDLRYLNIAPTNTGGFTFHNTLNGYPFIAEVEFGNSQFVQKFTLSSDPSSPMTTISASDCNRLINQFVSGYSNYYGAPDIDRHVGKGPPGTPFANDESIFTYYEGFNDARSIGIIGHIPQPSFNYCALMIQFNVA